MLKDKDIREPLFEFLEETFGKVRIIEEKVMGSSRADVVMVAEDALYGVEIKSDADTYARLERQVKDYNRFFDYNYIAVGTSHAEHVSEHLPDYWGIITVDEVEGQPDFYILRQGQPNPKREKKVKLRNQLSFLWRPELSHIQELNGMPRYPRKSKKFVVLKIMEKVEPELLKRQICGALLERDYQVLVAQITEYREARKKK